MVENPIVKIANNIRTKVGTTQKFTLPEIASMVFLPDNFPDFIAKSSVKQNGTPKNSGDTLTINGGDTVSITYRYEVKHADLLRKLIGSKANLYIACPVANYMDSATFANKAVGQTMHFLKDDGSELLPNVTIAAGDTQYAYSSYYINQQLTTALVDYLVTNRAIEVRYDNFGSHANTTLFTSSASCRLLLFG